MVNPAFIALCVAVPVGVRVSQLVREHRRLGPQRELLRHGEPAEATVLDRVNLEMRLVGSARSRSADHFVSIVLEVRRDGHPPYKTICKQWLRIYEFRIREREVVPVRVDRADPLRVVIDEDAKEREVQRELVLQRDRAERRQEQLMKT
jgi:hypothetical protein